MKSLWKKFNDWVKYNPPYALTTAGWRLFKKEFKEKAPIRYFFEHRFPKLYRPIIWKYNRITGWLADRILYRQHIINTGLKPGWYNINDRMLHGNFNLLKDYVEVTRALSYNYWNIEEYPIRWKFIPFYTRLWYRNPEFGIKALEWETTLDDPSLPPVQQSPKQAADAREILFLYNWWVNVRPARNLSNELSYDDQGFEMGALDEDFDRNAADFIAYRNRSAEIRDLENEHEKEDEEMHIRLIKISKSLYV
jgi:hypothetical protein